MAKLKMPPNCINVTSRHVGEVIGFIGAETFRKAATAAGIADRKSPPKGDERFVPPKGTKTTQ